MVAFSKQCEQDFVPRQPLVCKSQIDLRALIKVSFLRALGSHLFHFLSLASAPAHQEVALALLIVTSDAKRWQTAFVPLPSTSGWRCRSAANSLTSAGGFTDHAPASGLLIDRCLFLFGRLLSSYIMCRRCRTVISVIAGGIRRHQAKPSTGVDQEGYWAAIRRKRCRARLLASIR